MSIIQQWASIVDNVSVPSTARFSLGDVQANKQSSGEYEGYPFEEWDDLTEAQKETIASSRIGNALAGQVNPGIAANAIRDSRSAAMGTKDARDMAHIVQSAVAAAHRAQKAHEKADAERKLAEAAMNSTLRQDGDLMAEGYMLRKAKDHNSGIINCYERKVVFNRPVAQYTCLKGDKIAVGGDMLTGCTVTPTREVQITGHDGKPKTVYEAKAIIT